jgi:biotin carboxyl carrier protein
LTATDRAVRVTAPGLDPVIGDGPVVIEPGSRDGGPRVDGEAVDARLERVGERDAILVEPGRRTRVAFGSASGSHRELLVDGWTIEVEVESERRAALRERARRGGAEAAHGGPMEVRAIIPGRVVSVSVVPGDAVVAGQQLLVVEAMKMQNELRAPRDGTVASVATGAGRTIEVGDILLVLT